MNNLIVTSYWCGNFDVHHKKFAPKNDINYIKDWYQSVQSLKLNALIIHDGLSEEFIKRYQTDLIKFKYHNPDLWSINDERYRALEEILTGSNYDKVLQTDGCDVIINRDPFKFFTDPTLLYLGTDRPHTPLIKDNKWAMNKWEKLSILLDVTEQDKLDFQDFNFVNNGVIGGSTDTVLSFVKKLNQLFYKLDSKSNNNMMAINYLLWKNNIPHWRGQPLTSPFTKNSRSREYYIKHK
jgi:hypothetical protein